MGTHTPYAFATVRMWWAAAMAPVMDACCLSFARPLPAKYAAPPCETWRMMGDLMSLHVLISLTSYHDAKILPRSLQSGIGGGRGCYILESKLEIIESETARNFTHDRLYGSSHLRFSRYIYRDLQEWRTADRVVSGSYKAKGSYSPSSPLHNRRSCERSRQSRHPPIVPT